jgi:hypothetical protein
MSNNKRSTYRHIIIKLPCACTSTCSPLALLSYQRNLMNMGKCLVGAVCSTNKARHGPRAQQDSDGKLTREGSHVCRSTGPDTLVGGELLVLERLNEPSVAGWLRERVMPTQQAGPAAAQQYYQPRAKSPAHAHQPHFTLPLPLTLSDPLHRPVPYTHHPLLFLLRPISTPLPTRGNSLGAMT